MWLGQVGWQCLARLRREGACPAGTGALARGCGAFTACGGGGCWGRGRRDGRGFRDYGLRCGPGAEHGFQRGDEVAQLPPSQQQARQLGAAPPGDGEGSFQECEELGEWVHVEIYILTKFVCKKLI